MAAVNDVVSKFVHFISWLPVEAMTVRNCRRAIREAEGEDRREAPGTPIEAGRATAKAGAGPFLTLGVEKRSS
jgi:hypothetical protein